MLFRALGPSAPPWLRAFYEGLRARGKPGKVAVIAAMRKLMVAVWTQCRAAPRDFDFPALHNLDSWIQVLRSRAEPVNGE